MSAPYYDRHGVTVHAGDCLDVLRGIPDASVHAVICDPPYGLADIRPAQVTAALTAWANGDREHVPNGRGFMGRDWDAFVPPPAVWDECYRVLKPGGHIAAFAGSRTYDLMGLSIRLAGFEIRDGLQWLYGSGFPKSMDVSKAIDKAAGAEREVIGTVKAGVSSLQRVSRVEHGYRENLTGVTPEAIPVTAPATDAAREWPGWGTALKPAHEPIVLARKPLAGTVAANVLQFGTGALNIDATRVAATPEDVAVQRKRTGGVMGAPNTDGIYGSKVRTPAGNTAGRWPANVLLTHAPDCEDSACQPGCPVSELDEQSGTSKSPGTYKRGTVVENHVYGASNERPMQYGHGDSGGASRYFPTFRYQAKAPASERPKIDGISHPTVKPLALMRWLVRLVTPPAGLVLDPFAGSGTTLQAAHAEGFHAIGIEREPKYLPLIKARLDGRPRAATGTQSATDNEPMDLLDLLTEDGAA